MPIIAGLRFLSPWHNPSFTSSQPALQALDACIARLADEEVERLVSRQLFQPASAVRAEQPPSGTELGDAGMGLLLKHRPEVRCRTLKPTHAAASMLVPPPCLHNARHYPVNR